VKPEPIVVHPYRAFYYLNFKSTAVQRWAAKHSKDHYYALTPTLWRKLGNRELPEGIAGKPSAKTTLYFETERAAERAKEAMVNVLTADGVIK
jgi:hypothetical protein